MGTLRYQPIANLTLELRDKFNIKTLVETGTYQGESTSWASENFQNVITIDIMEEFQNQAKERCADRKNILFLLADTRVALPEVVKALPDEPTIFWLDAHNASGLFGRPGDDCPILEELDTVLSEGKGDFILIDDAACFESRIHDPKEWPEISAIEIVAKKFGYLMGVNHNVIALVPEAADEALRAFKGNGCSANINIKDPRRRFSFKVIPPKIIARGSAMQGDPVVTVDLPKQITEIVDTAYGRMMIPLFDTNQSAALRGGYSLDHVVFSTLIEYLEHRPPGAVFLDIGANVGCYSFALAPFCQKVHAFEPQRLIFNMMVGSVALNGWQNIHCYHLALGDEVGQVEIPQFDYTKLNSFGSIEFSATQKEKLQQERGNDPDKVEYVQTAPLDYFKFPRVDLIKIDVEGAEMKVLRGAKNTIILHRPILMVEYYKVHAPTLRARIENDFGYRVTKDTGMDFICEPKDI